MDIQREREAFECEFKQTDYYIAHGDLSTLMLCGDQYALDDVQVSFEMWQAAKAQSVPDTYTPIVLALEDVQSKIAKTSFLTMDEENENEVMAVNANELAVYIDELIEAQEPAND